MTDLIEDLRVSYRRRLGPAILRAARERRDAYERDAEEMRRQGFAPEYCPHGTYLWTDYDPMCFYCESGVGHYELVNAELNHQATAAAKRVAFLLDHGGEVIELFGVGAYEALAREVVR